MAAAIPHGRLTVFAVSRGRMVSGSSGFTFGAARLPTDPVGTTQVTFSGIHAGSEIRVYRASDGVELAGIENCADNQVLSWDVYPSPTVRIVIVSMDYDVLSFEYDSVVGAVALPIFQRKDKWYRNP